MNVTALLIVAHLSLTTPPTPTEPSTTTAAPEGDRADADKLLESPRRAKRMKGAKLLLDLAQANPDDFVAAEGGARALFLGASWSKNRAKAAGLAKRCWNAADQMIARWPDRAHGYYWAALCIGQYANSTNMGTAISEGLAGKMEKNAYAAIEREPGLYHKGAQRLLGCYFTRAPWPIGDKDKARRYLEEARKADPKDANGLLCLAETLIKAGEDDQANVLLEQCAALRSRDTETVAACAARLGK